MALIKVPCPLCRQAHSFVDVKVTNIDEHINNFKGLFAGKNKSEWSICGRCGFVHQNPRPSIDALNRLYLESRYHNQINLLELNVKDYKNFARWYYSEKIDFTLLHSKLNRGSVFDIGFGHGGVLKLYEERGWETYGIEPDDKFVNFATCNLGLKNIRQGILDSNFKLDRKVDLVVSNHAFEHFADLDEVMCGVLNLLDLGGYLFIVVPTYMRNRSSLSKKWMNSSHYSLFTHHSLNHLLSKYGFEEITHSYAGWSKEIDDLWYLAKYTGKVTNPIKHFEDHKKVSHYLKVTNPIRTFMYFPIYANWMLKVRLFKAFKLLFTSPREFLQKVSIALTRR